jgi:hypothetical protein
MRTLTLVTTLAVLLGAQLGAQEKATQKATDKAAASRGKSSAQDPNIKKSSEVNAPNANAPAPPSKGGAARQGVCEIHVDNRTALYVKIFVDGDFQGTVGPWGDAIAYAISGGTRLYGRADYTDGTFTSFGPRLIDCQGLFTWTLTP